MPLDTHGHQIELMESNAFNRCRNWPNIANFDFAKSRNMCDEAVDPASYINVTSRIRPKNVSSHYEILVEIVSRCHSPLSSSLTCNDMGLTHGEQCSTATSVTLAEEFNTICSDLPQFLSTPNGLARVETPPCQQRQHRSQIVFEIQWVALQFLRLNDRDLSLICERESLRVLSCRCFNLS